MFKTARATLDRLLPDLDPVIGVLDRKIAKAGSSFAIPLVTTELRMAGETKDSNTLITLRPSVWIICRDKTTCKRVQRRLDQLSWLNSSCRSPVYVRSASQLASTEVYQGLTGLDFNRGASQTLPRKAKSTFAIRVGNITKVARTSALSVAALVNIEPIASHIPHTPAFLRDGGYEALRRWEYATNNCVPTEAQSDNRIVPTNLMALNSKTPRTLKTTSQPSKCKEC